MEMDWKHYTIGLLLFNTVGALVVYGLQRVQLWLPLNPQALANVSPDSSFNTALSFITNTNWQGSQAIDHEQPDPDGGSGRAELPVRSHGNRSGRLP